MLNYKVYFLCLFLFLFFSLNTQAAIKYDVIDNKEGDGKILVIENTETAKKYNGPSDQYVTIEATKDFNQDGIEDALVSTWIGGTCCPPEYKIISLKDNKLVSIDIPNINHETQISVIEEDGNVYIKDTETDSTIFYTFDGNAITVAKTINKLAALKEVQGPGGVYTAEYPPEILLFDVDDDGKQDKITCPVWTRWGSLLCEMPLPNGKTKQASTGCARVGVLASKNNGYHEFVCNFDTVITFDGKKWIEKGDTTGREF